MTANDKLKALRRLEKMRTAIMELMADGNQRSAKNIQVVLMRDYHIAGSASSIGQICRREPMIETVGKWSGKMEYRMVRP